MNHGTTTTAYKSHGCRCDACRRVVSRGVELWRSRTQADLKTGVPALPDLVDIAPVRDHYWRLRETGWTVTDIASEVGITPAHLSWLMGPANTRPRVRRERAAAILALELPEPVDVDEVAVERFIAGDLPWRALSTAERIDAAVRMDRAGISRNEIAERTRLNTRTLWDALRTAEQERVA